MPKKKTKVNKLAKMSDEERAKYLQHRADLEEEARRRKKELIAMFIKNKLDKEEAYNRLNLAKLNEVWRFALRHVKCEQFQKDIKGMSASFEFVMERKNRLLQALTSAIEDADDQHRRIFQNHTESISYFLSICTQGLDKLQSHYDQQKQSILETWQTEEHCIEENREKAEFKLKLIRFIMDRDFKEYQNLKQMERATAVNDARLEHEEDIHLLQLPKAQEIERLRSSIREVYNTYIAQHKPMFEHYEFLRDKDDFYQRDIAKNDQLIRQANKTIISLQNEYQKLTSSMESKLSRLEEQKAELSKRFWHLKKVSKVEETRDSEALLTLVNSSRDAFERLEQGQKKLARIDQLCELCARHEVPSDRVPIPDVESCGSESTQFEHLDDEMIKECKEYKKLDKFMLRINRANVQNICLKSERAKLTRENAQIKNYLKKYLTEMVLNTEKYRPSSVSVRSSTEKVNSNRPQRPVTCIEGALSNVVMHEKRMKIQYQRAKESSVRAFPRIQNWM